MTANPQPILTSQADMMRAIQLPNKLPGLTGAIHAVGYLPVGSLPFQQEIFTNGFSMNVRKCVLTSVDLSTGNVKQRILDYRAGHMAEPLPDGRLLALCRLDNKMFVLNSAHEMLQQIDAPEGYDYGGHALVLPEKDLVILPCAKAPFAQTADDIGLFVVRRMSTLELVKTVPASGINPHQIMLTPDGKGFAVAYYGNVGKHGEGIIGFNVLAPRLVIYDLETFAPIRIFDIPTKYEGASNHLFFDHQGHIYAQLLQVAHAVPGGLKAWCDYYRKFNLPATDLKSQETRRRQFFYHTPLIRFNVQTGELEEVFQDPENFRYPLSSCQHPETGRVFIACPGSGNFVVREPDDTYKAIPAFSLGLFAGAGVCNIPNTPYVALCDEEHGITIFDAHKLKAVARYNVTFSTQTHSTYSSWGLPA